METKDIIIKLRKQRKLSQEKLAEEVFVSRQAVSKWERGESIPDSDTLKQLSQLFDVSINTLLGSPRTLICQCCGMPLEDSIISRESDNSFNEDYCKWCYSNGNYTYKDLEPLVKFLIEHSEQNDWNKEEAKAFYTSYLKNLKHWKNNVE